MDSPNDTGRMRPHFVPTMEATQEDSAHNAVPPDRAYPKLCCPTPAAVATTPANAHNPVLNRHRRRQPPPLLKRLDKHGRKVERRPPHAEERGEDRQDRPYGRAAPHLGLNNITRGQRTFRQPALQDRISLAEGVDLDLRTQPAAPWTIALRLHRVHLFIWRRACAICGRGAADIDDNGVRGRTVP